MTTRNILELTSQQAKDFFLKEESYSNILLPKYFSFQKLLNKLDKKLQTKELKTFCINAAQQPANFDDINYTIYNNKDGCYAWRPLQLLNPIIYVALVNYITQDSVWELITNKFKEFRSNEKILSQGLPVLKSYKKTQKANEGYIDKTCLFEVKRSADIPKRQIQILTSEQLAQLFKILTKKYSYMLPIVQKLITLKQPLNTILTDDEQQKKSLKRKIRKDFYKVKQEMRLENYIINDLRFCK